MKNLNPEVLLNINGGRINWNAFCGGFAVAGGVVGLTMLAFPGPGTLAAGVVFLAGDIACGGYTISQYV